MIAIFSGTQLLTLGIIGEYLGRVHVRTMDRPAYAIREQVTAPTRRLTRAHDPVVVPHPDGGIPGPSERLLERLVLRVGLRNRVDAVSGIRSSRTAMSGSPPCRS